MIKKIILIIPLLFLGMSLFADNGNHYFSLSWGYLLPSTHNIQANYEKDISQDVTFSVSGEFGFKALQFKTDSLQNTYPYRSYYWDGILQVKKTIVRYKNAVLKATLGTHSGAKNKDFFIGIDAGFEFNYVFRNGVQLVMIQKNQVNFLHNDTFLNGLAVGLKIPL